MRPSLILLMLICLVAARVAEAQSAGPLTEDEAVRRALEHNAGLQSARADAAEARATWAEARSGRLPSVDAQASYMRLSDVPSADVSFPGLDTTLTLLPVERDRYHAEISVEQPLFTGFRVTNQVRAARRGFDAADMRLRQAEADVAFQVRETYWRLAEAMAAADAVEAALATMDAYVREVRSRVDAGTALLADLLSVQTRRAEVRLQQVDAQNAVEVARLELNRLIGAPLDASTTPADAVAAESGTTERDVVADGHPQVEALRAEVAALQAQVRAAQGAWLPHVAAVGRFVYARPNPYYFLEQDEFRRSWEAGLTLRWSLFDGGRRSASTDAARARLASARGQLQELERRLDVRIRRQHLEAERAAQAARVAAEAMDEARESLRVAQRLFEEGMILASQLLDAEQAFREAELRLARSEADRQIARAALLNVQGRVW